MRRKWIVQGRVISGSRTAARFTQLEWVREQCRDKLGFVPYPGTLNLQIEKDFVPLVADIRKANPIKLIPDAGQGCAGSVIPVSIGGGTGKGAKGAIVVPDSGFNIHRDEPVIEILAPIQLRGSLGLEDGHLTTVFADRPGEVRLEAVIFDLDGTLLDSIDVYYKIVNAALSRFGLPRASVDVMREAAKDDGFDWEMVLPESNEVKRSSLVTQIQPVLQELYGPMFEREAKPVPGMKEAVESLAAAGMKLGIVTSTQKENMGFKLKQLSQNGTLDHFRAIVTSSDVLFKKPAPDPMIECCRQLDVTMENAVYVGDSRSDMRAGRSAGMMTIAVLSGFDGFDALCREMPDSVIDSVADLKTVIDYEQVAETV